MLVGAWVRELGVGEPLCARASNRRCVAFALLIQLAAPVAKPPTPALCVLAKPLKIKLDRPLNDRRRRGPLGGALLLVQALLGLGQRLTPALARTKTLRQLITASVTTPTIIPGSYAARPCPFAR